MWMYIVHVPLGSQWQQILPIDNTLTNSQGEFEKIANVANMFNASLYICMKHVGLQLN